MKMTPKQQEKDILNIHDTITYCGGSPVQGTNVSADTLVEYEGEAWYFKSLWLVSGCVTLQNKENPKQFKTLSKSEAIGLKILG